MSCEDIEPEVLVEASRMGRWATFLVGVVVGVPLGALLLALLAVWPEVME